MYGFAETTGEFRMKFETKNPKMEASRDGYGRGLVKVGTKNKNVVALCCDLTESTRVDGFKKKFPSRYVEVGIQEQNMAGLSAGMASTGKIPYMSSYAVFSPGRNWDQVRVSICYSNLNVKIEGAHAGISVGPDGATHQALEDISITRVLPNMTVIVPADSNEGEKATVAAARIKGPVYLRFSRSKTPVITNSKTPFKVGRAEIYRTGKDVAIIACGTMVYESLVAAEKLKEAGIDATVVNCHTVKPIDEKTIVSVAKKTGAIVSAEEHQINGGLGSAVARILAHIGYNMPFQAFGIPDKFIKDIGNRELLLQKAGLSHKEISKSIIKKLQR